MFVELRLRARQKNGEVFEQFDHWHIESDMLDSSFIKLYENMYHFINSPLSYRRKILALEAPQHSKLSDFEFSDSMTERQRLVARKAISGKDYFLIWGPPGTGKTSVMIKNLVDYYYNHTSLNIVLLAYTNRAVDEICDAIDDLLAQDYIRIGSRYSTDPRFHSRLLSQRISETRSRKDLKNILTDCRVYVATVSSFQTHRDIHRLKQFELAIIDEASQILEPMLVGVLAGFDKYIMIGDHKQLPAVVSQNEKLDIPEDDPLRVNSGLKNLGNSLFERLFFECLKNSWDWALDTLDSQGRMHQDILGFVSQSFYEGKLKILEGLDRLTSHPQLSSDNHLKRILINKRMIFVDTPLDNNVTRKTNLLEAELVARALNIWVNIYRENVINMDRNAIGVITPFRSQIAVIKDLIGKQITDWVTVDTVERYQGGSRNQILISLAVSKAQLLDSISNVSSEGIDRKLNVALTRAKENVVIFGCKTILERNPVYRNLISYCYSLNYEELLNFNDDNESINGLSG